MGSSSDPTTVVDEECRVVGVENLRVVDASIMPSVVSLLLELLQLVCSKAWNTEYIYQNINVGKVSKLLFSLFCELLLCVCNLW